MSSFSQARTVMMPVDALERVYPVVLADQEPVPFGLTGIEPRYPPVTRPERFTQLVAEVTAVVQVALQPVVAVPIMYTSPAVTPAIAGR